MNNAKHTPGPVEVADCIIGVCVRPVGTVSILERVVDDPSLKRADAELIAEAFNVATETGRTPRQLADRVKQLEAMVARFIHADEAGEL